VASEPSEVKEFEAAPEVRNKARDVAAVKTVCLRSVLIEGQRASRFGGLIAPVIL
jgi:hypothetical protein